MSDHSARLGLPYLAAAQAQKHVTHNEGLRRLDAYVHLTLESTRALMPPPLPHEGDCWFVPAGAGGDFRGHEGEIASWESGAFEFLPTPTGCQAFIRDEGRMALFDGAGWVSPLAATAHHAAIEAHVVEEDVVLFGPYTETRNAIPDRAIVLAVSTRTLSVVTGAASYDCGIAAERAKFGGALGRARGSANEGVVGPTAYYAPTHVRLSANGGAFTGGRVRVAIHYILCPAATVFRNEEEWWREPQHLLDGVPPVLCADLVRERYMLTGGHCSAQDILARSGGVKWVVGANGQLTEVPANTLAFDHSSGRRRMVLEGAATNRFLGSASAGGVQSISVTAQTHTLSFHGEGSFILGGAHVARVDGGGTNSRATYMFTPSAGVLSLTASGDVRRVQLEAGPNASSYIPTSTAEVTRVVDIVPWSEAAKGGTSSAGPCTMALRFYSNETWNPHVIQGVLGRQKAGATNISFLAQPVNLTPSQSSPHDEIGVCFRWLGRDRAISQHGSPVRTSVATADVPQPVRFTSMGVTYIDELLIWPVKGSDTAIQSQARVWA